MGDSAPDDTLTSVALPDSFQVEIGGFIRLPGGLFSQRWCFREAHTYRFTFEEHGETFKLKQHGAQNLARFDYFDDIRRLQFLKKHGIIEKGYAVFLTNDPLYWKPIKGKNFSSNFSMEDERIIESNTKLGWTGNPSGGSVTKKRLYPFNPIVLDNKHQLKWYEFSKLSGVSFKYLIIEI